MSKNFRVMIFDRENQSLKSEDFYQVTDIHLETKSNLYDLSDTYKYYNETDGKVYFIVNADLPAKQEASNLKQLRRSVALSNIFKYDLKKPFDIFAFMPWIVIIAMILFM